MLIQIWRQFHQGNLSAGMRRRHRNNGNTFYTTNLGKTCMYTIELDKIRSTTTDDFQSYGKSDWVTEAQKNIGPGVLMNDGEAWRQSRSLLKPKASTSDLPVLLEPHVKQVITAVRDQSGMSFGFEEMAAKLILDIVTYFLFGNPTKTLSDSDSNAENFLSLIKDFEPPAATFIAVGSLAWLELLPSYKRIIRL